MSLVTGGLGKRTGALLLRGLGKVSVGVTPDLHGGTARPRRIILVEDIPREPRAEGLRDLVARIVEDARAPAPFVPADSPVEVVLKAGQQTLTISLPPLSSASRDDWDLLEIALLLVLDEET